MFPTIAYPILVSAGVAGLWLLDRNKNLKNATPPNVAPNPGPGPNPNPVPADAVAVLARSFLMRVAENPTSVDPSEVGVLAANLRATGQQDLATKVEATGPILCAAQGRAPNCWQTPVAGPAAGAGAGAPAAGGGIPPLPANLPALVTAPAGSSQAGYQETIAAARLSLASVPLDRLQRFAKEARGSGLPIEAAWLDALAAQRAALGETGPQAALRAEYAQMKANPPKDLALADALVRRLGAAGLVPEAMDLAALAQRLRALTAQGFPGDAAAPNPNASTLPPALVASMNQLLTDPNADPVKIDTLISTIQMNFPGGFLTQISQLQKRAADLRQMGR